MRDNARSFGGDPNNVMIFGESGGGAKVSTLMATERAKGLFHRAVVQSGAMIRFPEAAGARAAADQVVEKLGLNADTISDIRNLPVAAIQEALTGTGAATAPSIDGRTLTRHPFEPDAAPPGRDVPMMLGTNRTENSLFVGAANPAVFDLTWEGLTAALQRDYPDADVAAIVAGYKALQPESDPADIYLEATTDARWLAGHVTQAERKSRRAAHRPGCTCSTGIRPSTAVNGALRMRWRSASYSTTWPIRRACPGSAPSSSASPTSWPIPGSHLPEPGNPNNPEIPEWPPYNLDTRPVMVLDESPELVNDARAAQRALFDDGDAYGNRYQR